MNIGRTCERLEAEITKQWEVEDCEKYGSPLRMISKRFSEVHGLARRHGISETEKMGRFDYRPKQLSDAYIRWRRQIPVYQD